MNLVEAGFGEVRESVLVGGGDDWRDSRSDRETRPERGWQKGPIREEGISEFWRFTFVLGSHPAVPRKLTMGL